MNDRVARALASVSIGLAAVAVVVALYCLQLVQERSEELHTLSDGVARALASQRSSDVPLHAPRPALDPGP